VTEHGTGLWSMHSGIVIPNPMKDITVRFTAYNYRRYLSKQFLLLPQKLFLRNAKVFESAAASSLFQSNVLTFFQHFSALINIRAEAKIF